MLIAIIVIVVLVALVGFVIVGFNKLRTSDIGAQEALGGIDVQLTRRAELIPNLVETVKGYAAHEKGVFEEVTRARAGVIAAAGGDDVQARAAADAALQQSLVQVNAVAEAYPDLKANTNFLELQKQLAETENQISFARQYYNDAVATLNKLRTTDVGAEEALGGIDVQLTRRADLIPNLVETVKGYAAHEKGVFEEVTRARAGVIAAAGGDDVQARAAADAALQQALVRVNAVAENYPELKANQNFLDLQNQLAETENQIAFARQYYNDAVATLNKLVLTIPWMLFTGIANVHKREFYCLLYTSDAADE